ncbi:MAG: SusC/RagA family TonB-linked outer membrane protein [Sphingobacteriales bacterium 50-39]|nr:SusC/RagA family TonB-linked outer membrane protein [Sphingobacteriales bacterium]OJW55685.1 MAG: SusC/RagA family TonB-linked outer membrane protein [Sphingobacteriales bacterium 50-39]
MQVSLLLLLIACMELHASGFAQAKINLQLKETTLKQVLDEVEKQTDYRFVYHTGTVPEGRKVSIHVINATLDEVLSKAFVGLPITYTVKDDNLVIIIPKAITPPADRVIRGQVKGPDKNPLAGVSVKITGSAAGTTTDADGGYSLSVPEGASTMEFSMTGYISQTVYIGQRSVIDVLLELSVRNLNEVIVTGYTGYTRNRSASAVTTVSADKINEVPVASFEQALQGYVPGLSISSVSGQPGTSASVILRGVGTITGNNNVLYVMDGIPIESNEFQAINPADIESITVLKDASAKALYGSRGSNGVIVITSKKGKRGRVMVNYSSQYGLSALTSTKFRMMNTAERKQFEEGIGQETGAEAGPFWIYSKLNPDYATKTPADKALADHIVDSLSHVNTNWRDLFLRDGKFMEQQISASGGNENIRFYSSLNYFDQQGIARTTGLKRYTLKNNVDFTAGRLTAGVNLSLGYSASNLLQQENTSSGVRNPLAAVYYAEPYEYPYWPNGKLVTTGDGGDYPYLDQREGSDSYERMLNSTNNVNQLKTILGTNLSYKITDHLTAKTRLGIDYSNRESEAWINPDSYAGYRVRPGRLGSLSEGFVRHYSLITTSGLTYSNTFNNVHDVEVTGLFEFLRNTYKAFGYTGYGLDARLPQTPAGIGDPGTYTPVLSGAKTQNATASYIALARYTYNNKYTLNGSFRYDGSSTVPVKSRWHGFYSAGFSWEVKKEDFMNDVAVVSNLRLRGSYGTTASPFANDFAYVTTYSRTSYGGNPGIIPYTPGNPDYNWEYAKELNIGFDLGLLKTGRIRLTAEFYDRQTYNLFFPRMVSATAGIISTDAGDANTIPLSSGKMQNRGVELDLQGDVIKNKDLTWTLGGNMAYNKNKVLDLGGYDEFQYGYTGIIRVGLPFGAQYAPKWAGVDPANGNPLYYDRYGKITTSYNEDTMSVAGFGTYVPVITGGFTSNLSYKGFTLSALFSFNAKVTRYNNEDYYNENPSFITSNQSTRMLYDRWKKPGDHAILPRISAKRNFSSRDFQNASYLRLRNVKLGYDLSGLLGSRKYIQGAQVYMQAQNLLTWTKWRGFDPENGNEYAKFSYPSPRTYTLGLNVNF